MALTPEQRRILADIKAEAKRRGLPSKGRKVKAAIETGIVEANLTNPHGGDSDSEGWRQERASLYPNPTNVQASVSRFFDEAQQQDTGHGSAGQLAARVQRPAAQYRGRYDQASGKAAALLGGGPSAMPSTTTTPGVNRSGDRKALLLNYLANRGKPGALLDLGVGLKGAQDTPATTTRSSTPAPVASDVKRVFSRAAAIDSQHLPYQWGGGHAGAKPGQPLDCSGAVSKVLGVNPRVSGEFAKWGKPGHGKVTVYANGHHTLMEINGHFWGTSATNPGGGAGWIPRSALSTQYLSQFTARHL